METDQILDLFNLGDESAAAALPPPNSLSTNANATDGREEDMVDVATGEVKEKGKKGWLDDLGELWDERGYEEEYNLDEFLKKMER